MVAYTSWMDSERDPLILVSQRESFFVAPASMSSPRTNLFRVFRSKGEHLRLTFGVCHQLIKKKPQILCFTWCIGARMFMYLCIVPLIRCVQPGWLDQRRPPSNRKTNTKVKICFSKSLFFFFAWTALVQRCTVALFMDNSSFPSDTARAKSGLT